MWMPDQDALDALVDMRDFDVPYHKRLTVMRMVCLIRTRWTRWWTCATSTCPTTSA